MKLPRFEVVHTAAGRHARFVAANGRTIWWTETYTRRAGALHAIELATGNPVTSSPFSNGPEVIRGHELLEVREVDER